MRTNFEAPTSAVEPFKNVHGSEEALQEELEVGLREGSLAFAFPFPKLVSTTTKGEDIQGNGKNDDQVEDGKNESTQEVRGMTRRSPDSELFEILIVSLALLIMGHSIIHTHNIPGLNSPPNYTSAMWFWTEYNFLTTFQCKSCIMVIIRDDFDWDRDVGFEFIGTIAVLVVYVMLDIFMVVTIIQAVPDK
ncbi:hypothetical protein I302_104925 [Kwoniella bestiolae CBS 10118]|uniref:Uncharacterized protein n=1 Tax=Kwoniella bestiolae CBS 10118 TaxID=1296100 RepID=A0A1B9FRD0_9TREE|nr:hypothetical protein I302_09004 [Kwoniella bestiolae CBS 10118]OCF21330.1 hypothetical protein I302_09004 [Kwoniella bestiolae CBS 10118]